MDGPLSNVTPVRYFSTQGLEVTMEFFKRHKNKFLTFGVVSAIGGVGLYMFDKYVERRVAEQREIETQQKLKQYQRQQQFENTQNIAEKTLNSALLPALKEVIKYE